MAVAWTCFSVWPPDIGIGDFEPEIIMVTPSYMLAIVDEFRRQGRDPHASSLRYGIFGAEPWTDSMCREIEDAIDLQPTSTACPR